MRFAVLGLGSAGRRHAANAAALGHEVIAFDPAVAEAPAGVGIVPSLEEAVAAGDAVIVASPNSLHADQAVTALEAGKPVLVEKPLAVEPADAERVVAAAAVAGTVCGVAMNLRFHPAVVELRRLIVGGELGEVRTAELSFGYDLRLWRPETDYRESYSARRDLGGGIALDAIHEFDYLRWLLGPVDSVVGETARLSSLEVDVEDTALAILRFATGAAATVSLNFFEPVYRRGAVLVGEDAVARWEWGAPELIVERRDGERLSRPIEADLAATYRDVVADFASAVEDGTPVRTSAEEGLEAVRVVDALKRSAAEGRRFRLTAG